MFHLLCGLTTYMIQMELLSKLLEVWWKLVESTVNIHSLKLLFKINSGYFVQDLRLMWNADKTSSAASRKFIYFSIIKTSVVYTRWPMPTYDYKVLNVFTVDSLMSTLVLPVSTSFLMIDSSSLRSLTLRMYVISM